MTRRPVGAAAVIFNRQGQVLLVRHTYGRLNWELPGGGAEEHETLTTTAIREVWEETGLEVVAECLSGIYEELRNDDMLHFVFLCRTVDAAVQPRPTSPEISACAYWSPNLLPRPISDFTIRRVQDALAVRAGHAQPLPIVIGQRQWLEDA